ncbi:cadherin-22 [Corvus cornix cornix]|uniref:cadherin-22 n=1 Tax=Corvus cornix cornix TaxID=932674 RepID=UPI00194E4B65|nr:cadherin-22 [Corvus cornix cornix]
MAKGLQGFSWTMLLLFCTIQELGSWAMHTAVEGPGLGEPGDPSLLAGGRVKRGWVWNQFFVVEEYTGTEPLYVGKIPVLLGLVVRVGLAHPAAHGFPLLLGHRYAIDRSTDAERIFDIDAKTGAIVTGKVLDRETAGWHNITVLAMEADNHSQVSRASLRIRILDVNDNPPELATPYEAAVCEDAKPGQLIQTISVVDRDEPQSGHRFYFTLAPEATNNHHFSLLDIQDNTAAVHTQRVGFNRQEQDVYLLPILVVDSGPPALSSTGTLTIRVCGCDSNGAIQSCNSTAYVVSATLSPGALIALLVCVLILVVLVLLILTLKRHHKSHLTSEDDEDMRDNVIKYNDEGGGEQDTEAYDMSALRSLYDFSEIKAGDGGGGPGEGGPGRNPASELHALPQWVQSPDLDFSVFRDYICRKVEQADEDLSVPPYDSFQTYAFEGSDSPVPSLSSINTWSSGSEQDFSYLGGWGPRFRQLAALYAGRRGEEDSEES